MLVWVKFFRSRWLNQKFGILIHNEQFTKLESRSKFIMALLELFCFLFVWFGYHKKQMVQDLFEIINMKVFFLFVSSDLVLSSFASSSVEKNQLFLYLLDVFICCKKKVFEALVCPASHGQLLQLVFEVIGLMCSMERLFYFKYVLKKNLTAITIYNGIRWSKNTLFVSRD